MVGLADSMSFMYSRILTNFMKLSNVLRFLLVGAIVSSVLYIFLADPVPSLVPFMVLLMRLHAMSIQNFMYHMQTILFPVLLKSSVFGITNGIARPVTGVAVVVVEYLSTPALVVGGLALVSLPLTGLFTEYKNRKHK